jgi:hypothetical protein
MMRDAAEPIGRQGSALGIFVMHPVVAGLVALLVALAIVSLVLFHRKASSARAGRHRMALDGEAILTR